MKKNIFFILASLCLLVISCDKAGDVNGDGNDGRLPAPSVTFSSVTAVSFAASWDALEGADSYRYEVSYIKDGRTVAVAARNIEETGFSLDGLAPSTDYTVRVVAKAGGKTVSDWFTGTVRTTGDVAVTFDVTPYERYFEGSFVYPYAKVKPSDSEVYYWVSAIPSESERVPEEWVQEDIDYYVQKGWSWDDLVAEGLILRGESESVPFAFTGYDHYHFIVAPVRKNMSKIVVGGEVSRSYRFWYESQDSQMQHEADYGQFAGEWLLQTSGTVVEKDGELTIQNGYEEFLVTISTSEDMKSLYLKGWGGERNRFADSLIKMDFESSADNYNTFGISFPQEIKAEDDVVWKYVSWYNFIGTVGGQEANLYLPYDDEMYADMPSWSKGFSGYMGNLNRTIIKIFPLDYIDGNGEGALMMSLWPYGISVSGDAEQDRLLNGRYEEPVGPYYLIRKDVADGLEMQLPDTGAEEAAVRTADLLGTVRHADGPRDVFGVKR